MTNTTHLSKSGPLTELDLRNCKPLSLGLPKLGETTVMNNLSCAFPARFLMKTYNDKPVLRISKKQITEFSELKKEEASI